MRMAAGGTDEGPIVISASVLSEILEKFVSTDVFALSDRSTEAKELGKAILAKADENKDAMETFSKELNKNLLSVVNDSQGTTELTLNLSESKFTTSKEKMWKLFHTFRCEKLKDLWSQFSNCLELNNQDPLLSQYITEESFKHIIDFKFKKVVKATNVKELTWEEHNALRYAAGYIPCHLIEVIKKSSSVHKSEFLSCLSEMGEENSCSGKGTFFDFTKKWVSAKSRGGLFVIKDEVYSFFLVVEKKTRECLPKVVTHRHTKVDTLDSLCKDDDIQFEWCMVSAQMEDELASQELLKKILDLWLSIRGFSCAGAYVEQYKQCTKVSSNKSVGLRKGLKRKRSEVEEKNT